MTETETEPLRSQTTSFEPVTVILTHLESKAAEIQLLQELLDLRNFPKGKLREQAIRYVSWLTSHEGEKAPTPDIWEKIVKTWEQGFEKLKRTLDAYGLIRYEENSGIVVVDWALLRRVRNTVSEDLISQSRFKIPYLSAAEYLEILDGYLTALEERGSLEP